MAQRRPSVSSADDKAVERDLNAIGADGYQAEPADPYRNAHFQINALLETIKTQRISDNTRILKEVLEARSIPWGYVLVACLKRIVWISRHPTGDKYAWPLAELAKRLIAKRLVLTSSVLKDLFETVLDAHRTASTAFVNAISEAEIVGIAERSAEQRPLSKVCQQAVRSYRDLLQEHSTNVRLRGLVGVLTSILGEKPVTPIEPNEAWSDAALQDLDAMKPKERKAWEALLKQAGIHNPHKPSEAWLRSAKPLLDAVGIENFKSRVKNWTALVGKPGNRSVPLPLTDRRDNTLVCDHNANVLRGLVWCCPFTADASLARMLCAVAIICFEKLSGRGQRSAKLGNGCVYALGELPGSEPVAQLARLRLRVKNRLTEQLIDNALSAAAAHRGMSKEELEEIVVPAYGLTEVGSRREHFGDFTAELAVTSSTSTVLRWFKAGGKLVKSVPAAIRKDFLNELQDLKRAAKDIQKLLPVQRARLEQLFLRRKDWELATWRERYFDHPMVGFLARRLIWKFQDSKQHSAGIWHEGRFLDAGGRPLTWLTDQTRVQLWHPLDEESAAVLAWRAWLEANHIQQPFKQAHREIYVLTDAERQTNVYSNRLAAHILKQHQLNALCLARGWKYKPLAGYDEVETKATLDLPAWNLRAEFWIELADQVGEDMTDTGVYLYVATDQVRFYTTADDAPPDISAQPLPLERIPPLVLSEVLRDTDLFVGVASVANDPTWADRGAEGNNRTYWTTRAVDELNASAQTRKAVLEQLVPRLKIAGRCSFTERFLAVRGTLHTYHIHLGSGNVLMKPNDQFLCIVPGRSMSESPSEIFLPFEGDSMLSIILSKAFLLADDTKISDASITRQLKR